MTDTLRIQGPWVTTPFVVDLDLLDDLAARRKLTAGEFDPAKHPRGKTTPESTPGSFAPGDLAAPDAQRMPADAAPLPLSYVIPSAYEGATSFSRTQYMLREVEPKVREIRQALQTLPPGVSAMLHKLGWRVEVGRSSPLGARADTDLNAMVFHIYAGNDTPGESMLHEVGHAVYDALLKSPDPEVHALLEVYTAAVEAEAHLTSWAEEGLSAYYRGRVPRDALLQETFAELMSGRKVSWIVKSLFPNQETPRAFQQLIASMERVAGQIKAADRDVVARCTFTHEGVSHTLEFDAEGRLVRSRWTKP